MFDIGFLELIVIAIVVLVIVGPERMPGFARKTGRVIGRFKRALSDVKQEIDNEIKADELKEILDRQAQMPGLDEIIEIDRSTKNTDTTAESPQLAATTPHEPTAKP